MSYLTIKAIKIANRQRGGHWFSAGDVAFFGSRVLPRVYGGHFFVTSERLKYVDPSTSARVTLKRLYTVRFASEDGSIDTVGEYQGYDTAGKAKYAASEMANRYSDCEGQRSDYPAGHCFNAWRPTPYGYVRRCSHCWHEEMLPTDWREKKGILIAEPAYTGGPGFPNVKA
jgi:hypothetical protein